MNPATLRPHPHVSRVTPEPIHAHLWYLCQLDEWGAQHGETIYQRLDDDGRYYQWISYMDWEIPEWCAGLVLHGPAPKSFGYVNPDFG